MLDERPGARTLLGLRGLDLYGGTAEDVDSRSRPSLSHSDISRRASFSYTLAVSNIGGYLAVSNSTAVSWRLRLLNRVEPPDRRNEVGR